MQSDLTKIGQAIGRIPSGCSILTAQFDGRATGMLASWIQQAGFDPPSVSVAVKGDRYVLKLIEESRKFALNIIGDDPKPMFKHFGTGFGPEDDAFARLEVIKSPFGPLLADAVSHIGCDVETIVAREDHHLLIGVVAGADPREMAPPYVHIRKSGLSY